MTSPSKKPSWRGKGYQPTQKSTSLGKRRWIATLLLCVISMALGWMFWQWWVYRDAQTHFLSVVVNQGESQSGQLDNLSVAPLRFTSSYPRALAGVRGKNIQLSTEFALDLKKLNERIAMVSQQSHSQDTLVCSIQAQCMTIADEPYLIAADFALHDSPLEPQTNTIGRVALNDFLNSFVLYPGTVVIALDAGDVVADVAAHCEQNNFLLKLQELVQKDEFTDRLWVLTSHSPGEISQDDLATQSRLFGRALVEPWLGSIRVPTSIETLEQWGNDRLLSLDELANYVYRRVRADSGQTQSPWLLRGGHGVVRSDKSGWPDAKMVTLAELDAEGRIQVTASPKKKKPVEKTAVEKENVAQKTGNATSSQESVLSDIWIQHWRNFEQAWESKINAGASHAWTLAECAPLAYREMRGKLVDAELRNRAGISDANSWVLERPLEPSNSESQRLKVLFESDPSLKRWDTAELLAKQAQAKFIRQVCHASLFVAEIRQLTNRLDALGEKSRPSLKALTDTFLNRPTPDELRTGLESVLEVLPNAMESLVNDSIQNPKPAVLESLILCGALTAAQREKVIASKQMQKGLALKEEYPTSIPELPPSWSKRPEPHSYRPFNPNTTTPATKGNDLDNSFESAIGMLVQQALRDDRLVAREDQRNSTNSRLALVPDPPERKKGWWHEWTQNGTPISQPLRLEPTRKVALSLKLDPYPRPVEVRISSGQLPEGLIGLKLDGVRIDATNPIFSRKWADIERNGQVIEVELETNEIISPSSESMVFKISSSNGPNNEPLGLRLRMAGKDRVELVVTRLISKDGQQEWLPEEETMKGRVIRLHPFAGHETRFAFDVINRSERTRSIQAELFPLPVQIGRPGILVSNDRFLAGEFNEVEVIQQAKKLPLLAVSKASDFKPNQAGKLVLLPPVSPLTPGSEPKSAAENSSAPVQTAVRPNVSSGMLLALTDVADPTFSETYLIEYDPTEPSEYIEAFVQVSTVEQNRTIAVVIKYRDANEDGVPDLAPTDNASIDVNVFREPWMGTNIKGQLNGKIDPGRKQPPKLSLQVPLDATKGYEHFLGVDISGFPRALSKVISLRDLEPQPLESFRGNMQRASIQSISDGLKSYWLVPPVERKPDVDFPVGPGLPAVFKQPKQLQANIALDWVNDVTNGKMQSAILRLGDTEKSIYGDRHWTFEATTIDNGGLTLSAKASDHTVLIDSSGMQNQSLSMRTITSGMESAPIEVVFDSEAPEISGFKLIKESVFKGEESNVEFSIQENGLSGISRFELHVQNSLGEDLVKVQNELQQGEIERRSRPINRSLPIGKLDVGNYKVFVSAFDIAGNGPTKSAAINLRIRTKPVPPSVKPAGGTASSVVGTIRGKVRFGNGSEPSLAKVALDSTGKSGEFKDGNFSFSEVPMGKYKLTAEVPYQSSIYVGEVTGEFKTEREFKKEIVIVVKKAK